MKNIDKIEQLRQRLLQMDADEFDKLLNEGNEITQAQINQRDAAYARTGYLRFYPEKINELAKPFNNAQQMKDYVGENQEQIHQAGAYIMGHKVERPEWFEDIIKNNQESMEECLKILNNNCTTSDDIYDNSNHVRLLNRLWTIHKVNPKEVRKLTPNITWKTNKDWNDDYIFNCLSLYPDTRELRKAKVHKKILFKVLKNKGVEFPKSYALYLKMQIKGDKIVRSKRGSYEQRDPLIQKYTLEGELLGEFTWIQIKEMGLNRSTITGALKGTNGQKTAYKFIWKYKE